MYSDVFCFAFLFRWYNNAMRGGSGRERVKLMFDEQFFTRGNVARPVKNCPIDAHSDNDFL